MLSRYSCVAAPVYRSSCPSLFRRFQTLHLWWCTTCVTLLVLCATRSHTLHLFTPSPSCSTLLLLCAALVHCAPMLAYTAQPRPLHCAATSSYTARPLVNTYTARTLRPPSLRPRTLPSVRHPPHRRHMCCHASDVRAAFVHCFLVATRSALTSGAAAATHTPLTRCLATATHFAYTLDAVTAARTPLVHCAVAAAPNPSSKLQPFPCFRFTATKTNKYTVPRPPFSPLVSSCVLLLQHGVWLAAGRWAVYCSCAVVLFY